MVNVLFYRSINEFVKALDLSEESAISTFYMIAFSDVNSNAQQVMPPYQRGFYQITYIQSSVSSRVKWRNSQEVNIDNTVYFLSPEHIFSWKWEKDVSGILIFFDQSFLNFSRIGLEEEFYELFDFKQENILTLSQEENRELNREMSKMYTDYKSDNPFKTQILQSELLALLYKLKSIYLQKEIQKGQSLNRIETKYRAFQNLIKNCFITQKSVKFYADQLFIGPNYLNEICQRVVQKNAKKVIQEYILNEAKKRLMYSLDDIAEIGFQLGYEEATHFVRFFKQQEGITPKTYRKQNKIGEEE